MVRMRLLFCNDAYLSKVSIVSKQSLSRAESGEKLDKENRTRK